MMMMHTHARIRSCTLTSIASRVIKALIQLARATTSHRIMSDVGNVLQIICEVRASMASSIPRCLAALLQAPRS